VSRLFAAVRDGGAAWPDQAGGLAAAYLAEGLSLAACAAGPTRLSVGKPYG
jgi:hypothetical protein